MDEVSLATIPNCFAPCDLHITMPSTPSNHRRKNLARRRKNIAQVELSFPDSAVIPEGYLFVYKLFKKRLHI